MALPVRGPAGMSSAGFLRNSLVLFHALPCWTIATAVRPHRFSITSSPTESASYEFDSFAAVRRSALTRRMSAVRSRQHPPIQSTVCTYLGSACEPQDRQCGTFVELCNAVGRMQEFLELGRTAVGRHRRGAMAKQVLVILEGHAAARRPNVVAQVVHPHVLGVHGRLSPKLLGVCARARQCVIVYTLACFTRSARCNEQTHQ